MKVIHLISGGDTGGAKTHVLSLLQQLNRTITAQLVCFREGEFAQEARDMGIPTEIFEGKGLLTTYQELKAYIQKGGYQIIHCHGSRANMMGAMLKKAVGVPVVTTVHSDYRLDYMGRPMGKLIYGTINTLALRRIDYHIGVSDAMVDLLISRNFPPQKLYAIYNGLVFDAKLTLTDRVAYLRGLGAKVEEDSIVVGIAARLNPVKDMGTLIRGFAAAEKECPRLRLIIAGDGQDKEMLTALAKELGVEEKVCFAGWISGMDDFYQALDINTLTSLSETFPYALTEGARYGLPTIASRVGGVPYLIDHAVNGYLFPAGDHAELGKYLIALAKDAQLRRTMGEKLRDKAADKFSLQKTVETQLAIYEDVAKRHGQKRNGRSGVLICGSYGRENAGDDAILAAIIREMKSIDPYMPITVLSRNVDLTRHTYRVNAIHTFDIPAWRRCMKKTRLYISGGGSLIQDVTSRRSLWYYLYNIRTAKRKGNKVMMYGCGIGPVIRENHQRLSAKVIDRYVDVVTLREPDSLEELQRMGVTRPEVHLSADPALILPLPAKEIGDSALLGHGIALDGRYVCFALRNWPGIEDKMDDIRAAARYAYEKHGLTPVFLAVEKFKDPDMARRCTEGLDIPHYSILDTSGFESIIAILSRMQMVVSMRLHALIFAAGQGAPLVGIVYDPKVSAFLRYIGEEQFVDLHQLSVESLCRCMDQAMETKRGSATVEKLLSMEQVNTNLARQLYHG